MEMSPQHQLASKLIGLCKRPSQRRQLALLSITLLVGLLAAAAGDCYAWRRHQNQEPGSGPEQQPYRAPRSPFAARRAADDSRPLVRVATSQQQQQQEQVVLGKFKAPAPNQMHRQRVPKSSDFATQTVGASYRVSDVGSDPSQPEKVVHGTHGASLQRPPPASVQRTVGAKIQVSDEGLNYPPSKLSADIYGNVAEIVTAPPELVDNDFLLPHSNRWNSARP